MPTWQEVAEFLGDFKSAIRGGLCDLVPRDRNIQGLLDLGLKDIEGAEPFLLGLTPADYCDGPQEDHDRSGTHVWIFGATINAIEAYIKVKLLEDRRTGIGVRAKILGIHPAERPLQYPLRGGGV